MTAARLDNSVANIVDGDEIYIIAEIGKNFIQTEEDRPISEYLENAKRLVDAAVKAGADAVKFQTHEVEDEILPIEFTSPHFQGKGSDRLQWVTRNMRATPLEEFWKPLRRYCEEEKNITFISTPMSRKAAQKLETLGVPFWKVGSADVQDYALFDFIAETKKPLIISCGMVSLSELDEVIRHSKAKGIQLAVLYCISQYPAPKETFNLSTIEYLQEKYPDVVIGFSDHSIGIELPLAAARLGARIIEKHFTLSRDFWGPDHKASALPEEFTAFVDAVRTNMHRYANHTRYLGSKDRELDGANNQYRPYFNKALVAGRDIPAGTVLTEDMIYAMRPIKLTGGLPAQYFYDILGKVTRRSLRKYEPLTEETGE